MTYKLEDLKEKFIKIQQGLENEEYKKLDGKIWYRTHRNGDTGIGKTFEDLLGKEEDNLQQPDFGDIELKAHLDSSLITLFTKSPNLPRGINTKIREKFGYNNDQGIKVLYATVPSGEGNSTFNDKAGYYFSVEDNKKQKAVKLRICNKEKQLVDDNAEWTYAAIEKALKNKFHGPLAVVETEKKVINGKNYYSYNSIIIISIDFKTFLNALDEGDIFIDLRMGAYASGKNKGKHHDHGTGFRIRFKKLLKYTEHYKLI